MNEMLLLKATLLFSAAVLLVALLRWPLRRLAGAQAQYQLWLLVPAVLLAAGLAALQPERPLRWQIDLPDGELGLPLTTAQPAAAETPPGPAFAPARLLLTAWGLGGLGCGLVWSVAQRRLLRSRRLPPGGSAALVGAWKPRLRLPADFRERFPAAERRLILLHERLHAERGDTRWLLLALSLVALQWFNPLAWWALRRLRADMELACDAAVLRRQPQQLAAYRQALLRAQGDVGLTLLLTATPCSSHPLIERLSMLPTHRLQTPRRGAAALLIAWAAGLAYAAQPAPPALPTPPAVVKKALPSPPAQPSAKTTPVPGAPALEVKASPAPPAPPIEPPPAAGYSKLRVDYELSIDGQVVATDVLLQTFNERLPQRIALPAGGELLLLLEGRPHRDERLPGQDDLVLLQVALFEGEAVIGEPRLITKDGVLARIETGEQGKRVLRLDLLPRFVTTPLHDARGALAELKRDIEAGKAPAVGVKP